ncbi:glycerophosphodiester phosphodiesterase family protein [Aerococcus sp. UMB10185]|uniref:glycerophosphodiester phosphodiesterase family protein n=1 Tax=unclassified Aerococcus TaxID=2618060 RepID=UPI0008A105EF|nr:MULTISPECIES: glycerophosphodiester phosphodiesterase family protein [unclassified Aerococcus]MDK6233522.1 glycerophosphodiester phosphodiesterase family protein [Aerococcus sp. UMB10185]MDK6856078.1 glycerophosphodiester phosphodiesterase family protein [Aerococcus sp. UMB7533]MDK8501548.1 glycerophosphodiester phosphodiesterase family protein [Aerococcus sp. UMB1112A]OFN01341.1 hypothetical protein HMPREF2626_07880 [Aerococcus sp. HMSC062A02]OHO46280.1 hypothetical protein HMPREF2705_0944
MKQAPLNKFTDRLQGTDFLIMAHRGFWGGNVIQNTRQAAVLAKRTGADVVEVDVCRSSDGVYYLFHNENEASLLGILGKDFSELPSSLIDQLEYTNSTGDPSGFYPERLADFLDWLPANYLVNIDRAWAYFGDEAFIDIIRNSGKADQLLFKSQVEEGPLQALNQVNLPLNYMAIIHSQAQVEEVVKYDSIHLVGFELIVKGQTNDLMDSAWRQDLLEKGYILTVNSEKLGKQPHLYLDYSDQEALLGETGYEVWRAMLGHGTNAFITDWPNFMADFRSQGKKCE